MLNFRKNIWFILISLSLFAHTMALANDVTNADCQTKEQPKPLAKKDINRLFPDADKETRTYMEGIIDYQTYVNEKTAIKILLRGNKVLFFASPRWCIDKDKEALGLESRKKYKNEQLTISAEGFEKLSSVASLLKILNWDEIKLGKKESEFEKLTQLIDYLLLWNREMVFTSAGIKQQTYCHNFCLENYPINYPKSSLCKSYKKNVVELVISEEIENANISCLLDHLLDEKIGNKDLSNTTKLILSKIVSNSIDKTKIKITNNISIPDWAGGYSSWSKNLFKDKFLTILANDKSVTFTELDIFDTRSFDFIYLSHLFDKARKTGYQIEAGLTGSPSEPDRQVIFKIVERANNNQ